VSRQTARERRKNAMQNCWRKENDLKNNNNNVEQTFFSSSIHTQHRISTKVKRGRREMKMGRVKSLCEKKYNDEARTSTEKLFVGEFSAVIFFLFSFSSVLCWGFFFLYVGNELFCELGRFDMLE
jgi:hypothetical protein